jgi:hypothetical protein
MLRSLLLAVLLAWLSDGVIHAQCIPPERSLRTETFSTIKEVSGQGPAGSELQLEEQGERVVATLTDYRGGPVPVKTKLRGNLEESKAEGTAPAICKVRLSGQDKRGPVKIEGEITPTRFLGMVRRRIGKDVVSFRLSLRRQMQLPGDDRVARWSRSELVFEHLVGHVARATD